MTRTSDFSHICETGPRKLDPDRVHQQDDSDFRKQLEHMNLRYSWARSERTNNDASEHITDDQWLAESPGNQAPEEGGDEHVGQVTVEG